MVINKQQLDIALSTIHDDDRGFFSSGHFIDLEADLHTNVNNRRDLQALTKCASFIGYDLWGIETIALRLDWQKTLFSKHELDKELWMMFAACDVDLFHVTIRSIFDYVAKIAACLSAKQGQTPDSFEKLRNWLMKSDSNVQKIGEDLAVSIISCEWFSGLKEVRDSIIHRGGNTLVFPMKDQICFQVHEGLTRKILIPAVMSNKNVVNFELYAGLLTAYLIAFLEEVSEIVYRRINLKKIGWDAKSYHSGLGIIRNWIERIVSLKEAVA